MTHDPHPTGVLVGYLLIGAVFTVASILYHDVLGLTALYYPTPAETIVFYALFAPLAAAVRVIRR